MACSLGWKVHMASPTAIAGNQVYEALNLSQAAGHSRPLKKSLACGIAM